MKTYGNNIKTIRHVSKVGFFFFVITYIFLAYTAYINGHVKEIFTTSIVGSIFIGALIPFVVTITAIINIGIFDDKICLILFGRYRFKIKPINKVSSIIVGRLLLKIAFEDGTSFYTLGMYIPDYYRLAKDIRSQSKKNIKVSSNWMSIK